MSGTIICFPVKVPTRNPEPDHQDFFAWSLRGIEHMHAVRDWCRDNHGCVEVQCTYGDRFEPCDRNQRGPVVLVPRRDPPKPAA